MGSELPAIAGYASGEMFKDGKRDLPKHQGGGTAFRLLGQCLGSGVVAGGTPWREFPGMITVSCDELTGGQHLARASA